MSYTVRLTSSAEADLRNLFDYISLNSGKERASAAVARISGLFKPMAAHPESGQVPPELQELGITGFRQLVEPPCRLIYSVNVELHAVYVLVIADGRRDFSSLLQRRLLS